jgi:hypothetical protein
MMQIKTEATVSQFEIMGPTTVKWNIKKNSMVWFRERTIPTEPLPLVGEVIANICG